MTDRPSDSSSHRRRLLAAMSALGVSLGMTGEGGAHVDKSSPTLGESQQLKYGAVHGQSSYKEQASHKVQSSYKPHGAQTSLKTQGSLKSQVQGESQ